MTISPVIARLMTAALFAVLVAGFGGRAKAEEKAQCQAFPKVTWWGNISHDRVISYVSRKQGGDWNRYIAKWERQLKNMVDIYDRNSTAVIKKRGVRLSGDELGDYIVNIVKRISVTRCLAGEKADRSLKTF